MSEQNEVKNVDVDSEKTKTRKNKDKRHWLISFFMGIFTIGLWNRFLPRKKGAKGTWAVSVFLLVLICSALIGERFFKSEINTEVKQALNTEIDVIPEKWSFEAPQTGENGELEMTSYEDLANDNMRLKARLTKQELALTDVGKEMMKYKSSSLSLASENEKLVKELDELKTNPIKVFVQPEISLISYSEIQKEVGCSSVYSNQKRIDVFKEKFADKWVKWTGKISSATNDTVTVNGQDGSGFKVAFKTPGVGYDLTINDDITLTFKLNGQGTCDSPFTGESAIIE